MASGAARVDRFRWPGGGQQYAAGHRAGRQPGRHRADARPPRRHRPPGSNHRGDRVREEGPPRPGRCRVNPGVHEQHREIPPHHLGPGSKPAQPPAHRLHGRPSRSAITRTPAPAAFAARAAPITSAISARLTSANTGRSTCETPQLTHLVRRGRTTTRPPAASRSTRERAQPHRVNSPSHAGQTNSPAAKRISTRAGSASTVSTAPPRATRPSRRSAKRYREGLSHARRRQGAAPNLHLYVGRHAYRSCRHQTAQTAALVGISNDA